MGARPQLRSLGEADLLIKDLKANDQSHMLDGIAFHHYGGLSKQMAALQSLHPDIPVMFTEGSVWGLNGDKNRRGFETVIQHLRNGATTYNAWVTMITQNPERLTEAPTTEWESGSYHAHSRRRELIRVLQDTRVLANGTVFEVRSPWRRPNSLQLWIHPDRDQCRFSKPRRDLRTYRCQLNRQAPAH